MLTLNSTPATVPPVDSTFGTRLRALRLERNLTQRELAERVAARIRGEGGGRGFDFTYLSKIENDKLPPPSVPTILQLAAVLDANADELLALAKRAHPDVAETFKRSEGARTFFRSARDLNLTEKDWRELLEELRRREGESE